MGLQLSSWHLQLITGIVESMYEAFRVSSRLCGSIDYQGRTFTWHSMGFSDGSNIGPTV